jgi:hypothetical protein
MYAALARHRSCLPTSPLRHAGIFQRETDSATEADRGLAGAKPLAMGALAVATAVATAEVTAVAVGALAVTVVLNVAATVAATVVAVEATALALAVAVLALKTVAAVGIVNAAAATELPGPAPNAENSKGGLLHGRLGQVGEPHPSPQAPDPLPVGPQHACGRLDGCWLALLPFFCCIFLLLHALPLASHARAFLALTRS